MATVVSLSSVDDPRVSDYANLTDVALRRRVEADQGLFLAEGEKVIRRALSAGFAPRSLLMAPRWYDALADVVEPLEIPIYLAPEELLEGITGYLVHRGALAAMNRRPTPTLQDLLPSCERLLVLEGIVEHANVGAAFRSAAALGVDAVLIDPRCADPLYRRSIKVSMGAVFSLPWARAEAWPTALDALHAAGFELWALTPDETATDLDAAIEQPPDRLALMIGTEGPGLSSHALRAADRHVKIVMSHGVDSLNVAAAAAVACYATRPGKTRPE